MSREPRNDREGFLAMESSSRNRNTSQSSIPRRLKKKRNTDFLYLFIIAVFVAGMVKAILLLGAS